MRRAWRASRQLIQASSHAKLHQQQQQHVRTLLPTFIANYAQFDSIFTGRPSYGMNTSAPTSSMASTPTTAITNSIQHSSTMDATALLGGSATEQQADSVDTSTAQHSTEDYDLPGRLEVLPSYKSNPQLLKQIIQTVGTALGDDPVAAHITREGKGAEFFIAFVDFLLSMYPNSSITTYRIHSRDGKVICGAVGYELPRNEAMSWSAFFSAHLLTALRTLNLSVIASAGSGFEKMDEHREAFLKEHGRTFFVFAVGTDAAHRSKGLGAIAMRALAEHADKLQLPMYLEATGPQSAKLYERLEYHTLGSSLPLGPGGPPITFMWRPVGGQLPANSTGESADAGSGVAKAAATGGRGQKESVHPAKAMGVFASMVGSISSIFQRKQSQ